MGSFLGGTHKSRNLEKKVEKRKTRQSEGRRGSSEKAGSGTGRESQRTRESGASKKPKKKRKGRGGAQNGDKKRSEGKKEKER